MSFNDYSNRLREQIAQTIRSELAQARTLHPSFSGDSSHIFTLIEEYSLAGKMLRGVLACLSAELFSTTTPSAQEQATILKLGAALELLQAGLLIHDDIMDEDSLRRGLPTLHKRFEREAKDSDAAAPSHLGEALAICAGDICFFAAWDLVSSFGSAMHRLFSKELTTVCLAQSRDVSFGAHKAFPKLQDILEVYTYKTARYTICLPLLAGALAAGKTEAAALLEEIGLNLGLLFQLKDDYLGLFGDEARLGKPVGSDLREGKKTPYMVLLYPTLSSKEKLHFDAVFGKESIDQAEVAFVRNLIISHGIDKAMEKLENDYAQNARTALADLFKTIPELNSEAALALKDFVEYSLSRTF
ncbi:MAG: polyprenyl synthetase family protein [Spirochaetales bacterium]|nr:polyprenyl synthetase family protein [Spirochaetales bacterium]